ncbi:PREDICTED: protein phosphatase 1 regulatory subunit 14C isoform X2 [Chinchilla lanigera]|uniref:protein phosphatase 1 regulatory subunit 14C isoform X2 n=1 Tax=Chinchilla lanigera TaxID=34839 RepID=UPI000695F6D2|nr:PREDICTED: protein phosphatase 1 regulatory subunit 14C isoform X2 [Chinchilla lanigera]
MHVRIFHAFLYFDSSFPQLSLKLEEEMPDVEIDIDDLLDADSEEERASKLQEALVDCYKPTEEFIKELLSRIRGMRKLSPPQKKSV